MSKRVACIHVHFIVMMMMIIVLFSTSYGVNGQKLRATPNRSQIIKDKANMMNNKCIISMSGLDCPDNAHDKPSETNLMRNSALDLPIVAGIGYSRMDHSIKPQIILSPPAVRISSVETLSKTMNSAEDYFGMLYPKDGSTVFNGLFSHGATASDLIFSQFFAGNLFMMNSQHQVFTHNVEVSTIQASSDFQQIIDILPTELDESLYRLVITSFGDSIATKVKYGGVVDMTVSVRSCYSDPSMMKYLESQLHLTINEETDTKSIPNGYMRYHQVAALDIVGGDPQIQNTKQRIGSFERNPVPVRMELVPIWRAFPAGPKQENMKKVYNKYVEENSKTIADRVKDLNTRRNQENLKEQPFYIYATDSSNGLISKFTNDVQIAAGNKVVIDKTIRRTYFVGIYNKNLNYLSYLMNPVVTRNLDGSFFFDFNVKFCEIKLNVPTDACKADDGVFKALQLNFQSKTVSNKCEKVSITGVGSETPFSDVIVCSGCQPSISSNFKEISCQCPYVQ